jgi:hypothetical protein
MTSDVDVATHAAAADEGAGDAADNPILLGLPCAVIGILALGLFLLGYAPRGAAGALVPLFAALGIGLFIAARWAIAGGAGPIACIFGLFGTFANQGILRTLAGLCCLVAGAAGCYVFAAALTSALGGKELPLGRGLPVPEPADAA